MYLFFFSSVLTKNFGNFCFAHFPAATTLCIFLFLNNLYVSCRQEYMLTSSASLSFSCFEHLCYVYLGLVLLPSVLLKL
jgi:hypothetical protein